VNTFVSITAIILIVLGILLAWVPFLGATLFAMGAILAFLAEMSDGQPKGNWMDRMPCTYKDDKVPVQRTGAIQRLILGSEYDE